MKKPDEADQLAKKTIVAILAGVFAYALAVIILTRY